MRRFVLSAMVFVIGACRRVSVMGRAQDGAVWEYAWSPTAYVFRCRACGALGGYQDCD